LILSETETAERSVIAKKTGSSAVPVFGPSDGAGKAWTVNSCVGPPSRPDAAARQAAAARLTEAMTANVGVRLFSPKE